MTRPKRPDIVPSQTMGALPTAENADCDPMTEKQAALLRNLCDKAHEPYDTSLTRRQARNRIYALRDQLGLD